MQWSTTAERTFIQTAVPVTATISSECLWSLGVPTLDMGRTLQTAVGPVEVTEECGGIRSLHLVFMAGLFWAGFFRMSFGRGLILTFFGILLAIGINILRMVLLARL